MTPIRAADPLAADSTAKVLILTTFDLDDYVYEAICAGASGFVLKDEPPERLVAASARSRGSGGSARQRPALPLGPWGWL